MQAVNQFTDEELVQSVNDTYSAKAKSIADNQTYTRRVAEALGYTPAQLQVIPSESQMGLGCGNPVAAASIKEGETVLDLGCGGGIDVFLAAKKVGEKGRAIGLDISADMIRRATENAKRQNLHPPHVEFIQASLTETLPVASDSVDCILSNCVLNLLPPSGKISVIKEAYRVLKPGGRITLDDIISKKPLPFHVKKDLATYVGCSLAGAIEIDEYKQILITAGFTDLVFTDTLGDLNIYASTDTQAPGSIAASADISSTSHSCAPKPPSGSSERFDANEWVASYQVYAIKPV